VIRASRGMLERACGRRWLGPAVGVVLVVLVLLIGLHVVADEFVEEAALICAVMVVSGLIVVPLAREKPSILLKLVRKRSPPRAASRALRLRLADGQGSFPLRR